MRVRHLAIVAGVLGLLSSGVLASACSDHSPPLLGDYDGGKDGNLGDIQLQPCSTSAPGCPCPDAGMQEICGTVYHYSGSYITCSKEYITCQEDGTWSACVGPTVLGAD